MRAFVVVNPVAGGGRTRRRWPPIRERLRRAGFDFEAGETTGRGTATALARRAVDGGFSLVVAVGGDGTVNEVVNGLTDPSGRPLATLGVLVTGRGRDVSRNLGVASDLEAGASRLVSGSEVRMDLGVAEWEGGGRRYFVGAAGVGFDAAVAERARSARGSGTVPYLLAVLGALRSHRAIPVTISLDDETVTEGPVTAAVVANGAYYGGGMKIAPAADPADGRLDLVVLGDLGRLELLRWLPTVYRGGHLAHPRVATRVGRKVVIRAAMRAPMHLDGEPVEAPPVWLSVCGEALRLRR